jgi:hypothetical protein
MVYVGDEGQKGNAMPLHDWTDRPGWDGAHHLWITELLRWIKPRLPAGYRAYIGTAPTVAIGAPAARPDVAVHKWHESPAVASNLASLQSTEFDEPDDEVAVATLDPGKALLVEREGQLIAAVELISPRNKDRPVARASYLARYAGYLMEGVHLLLVDVHRRPIDFSFADAIAQQFELTQPACPPPLAVSYRVGEPAATGGRLLAIWRRKLTVGEALPMMVLPLTVDDAIQVDLEHTYVQAAADAYVTD